MDRIPYMGTKKWLADDVADIVRETSRGGAVLDLFSGMCAISESLSPQMNVWNNDAQLFAYTYAKIVFTAKQTFPNPTLIRELASDYFLRNSTQLNQIYAKAISLEKSFIELKTHKAYALLSASLDAISRKRSMHQHLDAVRRDHKKTPFCLFSSLYGNTYFGIRQAIEADSIVFAIHKLYEKRILPREHKDVLTIALGRALLKVATTTGHFAQYQTFKPSHPDRFISQRKRALFDEWLACCGVLAPIGTKEWRKGNRVFCTNAVDLLQQSDKTEFRPSIIYADPPYTTDQYSRFYHLLETLIKYDYPQTTAKARYRENRFQSKFCLASTVVSEFEKLVHAARSRSKKLLISYPANGLLVQLGESPYKILKREFRTVELLKRRALEHSTFGASSGVARSAAIEHVYYAHQ